MTIKTGLASASIVLLALGACSTTGVQVSAAQAQQFTVGQSTVSQVEAKLGQPTGSTTNSDGTQTITYTQENNQADPMAYVPVAGMFSYGSKTNVHAVSFLFNRYGVLQSYRTDNRTE